MKCTHCGSSNPDSAKFCYSCGQPLGSDDTKTENCTATFDEGYEQDTANGRETNVEDNNPKSSASSSDSSTKAEQSEQESDQEFWKFAKEFFSAANNSGGEFLNEEYVEPNDTVCPYCGGTCSPLQKNSTSVKTRGYSAGNGACGMCLLGPFGLLCGLCGSGSKTESISQTWWVCAKCGKQHLSHKEVIEAMDHNMERMPLTMFVGGVVFSVLLWWMFGMSFFHALFALALIAMLSIGIAAAIAEIVLEQSGHNFSALPLEKRKEYFHSWVTSSGILLATTFLACPLLEHFLL